MTDLLLFLSYEKLFVKISKDIGPAAVENKMMDISSTGFVESDVFWETQRTTFQKFHLICCQALLMKIAQVTIFTIILYYFI